MTRKHKIAAIGVALLMSLGISAQAADYVPPDQIDGSPQNTVVEFGTGWYLRGDIGGTVNEVDPQFSLGGVPNGLNLGRTGTFAVGAGYTINRFIRFDATVEQFTNLDFEDRNAVGCGVWDDDSDPLTPDIAVTGVCSQTDTLGAGATVVMANAYLDLGNYGAFTPYVGGGVGAAYVRWEDYLSVTNCSASVAADCQNGGFAPTTARYDSNKEWKPAAAVMAGFSYDLTQNLKLDAGYKFTYIGGGDASNFLPSGGGFANLAYDSFQIHQVRVGLRYEIW